MMKKVGKKIIKKIGTLFSLLYQIGSQFVVLILIIFATLLALFYTNPGAKLSLGIANLFLTYPIHAEEVVGTLAGPLTLKNVSTQNPAFSLTAQEITANWAPTALQTIQKGIHLKQLKAHHLKIVYHDDQKEWFTEIPSLEKLNQHIQALLKIQLKIEDFQTQDITLHVGKEPFYIQSFNFTRGGSHQNHLFKTLEVQAKQGSLRFDQTDENIKLRWDVNIPELNNLIPALKGDVLTNGYLILHDFNQIDNDTIIKLHLKSKQINYQSKIINNLLFSIAGNFEKHDLHLKAHYNDHQIDTTLTGKINSLDDFTWHADLKNLFIHHKRYGKLPASTGHIQVEVDKIEKLIKTQLNTTIIGNNPTNMELILDQNTNQLSGQIEAQLLDLDFLVKYFPVLEDLDGQAALTLQVKGDVFDPIIWGNLAIRDCTVNASELSNLSTKLVLSNLNLDSTGDGKLNISGTGTLGKGQFTIEGTSDFTQANPLVDLTLKGKNLTLSQTPEYFIIADPTLRLQLKDKIPSLSGHIFIPEADIETQVFGSDLVEPSKDMVIIDSAQAINTSVSSDIAIKPGLQSNLATRSISISERAASPSSHSASSGSSISSISSVSSIKSAFLNTNIDIELGDKIRYKGFGLESNVVGKLNLFTQNSNFHARGKLNLVNGRYKAHGNLLEIQHGHISFLGDQITNPTWDIRAAKQIYTPIQNKLFRSFKKQQNTALFDSENYDINTHKPVLVGISLKGTVQNPSLKMFSVPTLKEADIISYLVLNKPQRDASEAQTTLVLEAANELLNFLSNKRHDVKLDLAKNLKLDKFGLNQIASHTPGQSDLKQTALVIGKQLSNKLYAEYSLRVLDTASTLSLRYLVGKHIVLEGSASKDSASGDILFTFESG